MTRACAILLVGCSPPYAEMLATTSSDGSGETTSSSTTTTSVTSIGSTATSDSSTTDDVYMTTFSIMHPPDLGSNGPECDLFSQDCPPGEKCMPWANDGGAGWNAVGCFPVVPEPNELGEPCTVFGSGVSGLDDCARGTMCWNLDSETLIGECTQICHGSEANPLCDEPCASCFLGSTLVLCLESCDPLPQSCADGEACYPVGNFFACGPDVSGTSGVAGDTCEFINVCDPGLLCVNPDLVPGCDGASCCTPFCDTSAPDACDVLPGTVCTPWFEVGEFPDTCFDTATIGFCAVPP